MTNAIEYLTRLRLDEDRYAGFRRQGEGMSKLQERRTSKAEIRLTPTERSEIEARAEAAGLSLSDYVRVAARSAVVQSRLDHVATRELAATAGNLGLVGGLLKLWLIERQGEGIPAPAIGELYSEIREIIAEIRRRLEALP